MPDLGEVERWEVCDANSVVRCLCQEGSAGFQCSNLATTLGWGSLSLSELDWALGHTQGQRSDAPTNACKGPANPSSVRVAQQLISLKIAPPAPQRSRDDPPYYVWDFPDGSTWSQFYRTPAGFLLRFSGFADFYLSSCADSVTCIPAPNASQATVEHLYNNQVLPLALSKLGKLVFHASSVEVEAGAIAFVGQSGRGKSTLAAGFALNGRRFLGDDALVVEVDDRGYLATPSAPALRLWEDSEAVLFGADAEKAPSLDYTSKSRLLAGQKLLHCEDQKHLRTIYFLGTGAASSTIIRRLTPLEAVLELTRHSFLLEIDAPEASRAHFGRIAAFANSAACFSLDYPRRYDQLGEVVSMIEHHARSQRCS